MINSNSPTSRRGFLKQGGLGAAAFMVSVSAPAWSQAQARAAATDLAKLPKLVVDDATGATGRSWAAVAQLVALDEPARDAIRQRRIGLREEGNADAAARALPCQIEDSAEAGMTRLWFQLPPGAPGRRTFSLCSLSEPARIELAAVRNAASGQYEMSEAGKPVLVYNYQTVEPGELLKLVAPGNLQYARPRSNYIHPLYGLDGETLTKDWSKDHPHHRGIYWAWPEVDWRGQRGDLHALQKVFARPTGKCSATAGPVFAGVDAENLWKWEDRDAIIRERAVIRAYHSTERGRLIDLEYEFYALEDKVEVARRGTNAYGGLNVRCSEVREQDIQFHTDPAEASPRMVWADLSGRYPGGEKESGFAIFQSAANPHYPGDWVKYPDLNWFQPTFPAAGIRHGITKEQPLRLRFRFWIHRGRPGAEAQYRDQWQAFAAAVGA